jgi:ABC-type dipeptide/oligopeptide/nickel transport system ATPase component
MSAAELLSVSELHVSYGQTEILHGVNLKVAPGEIVGLVGESGSGKTTLGMAILSLLPPNSRVRGTVSVDGADLTTLTPGALRKLRGEEIAAIFQDAHASLDPAFTIGSQFTEMLRAHRPLKRAAAAAEAARWLDMVGIPSPRERLAAYPHELSGGMAQRVAIAMALSLEPRLVIADEPTSALDVTVQVQILDLLRDLVAKRDTGMVLISHDLGVVAQLCDRVGVMAAGQLVEDRPVRELFASPAHEETRRLLDTRPGHRHIRGRAPSARQFSGAAH